ncbi:MAG: S-layer homology domain-containing protein [Oscillospiraceae bacterium]|nr:S-layer homology domain-containing protein [Oscillospiraceae bacterium]
MKSIMRKSKILTVLLAVAMLCAALLPFAATPPLVASARTASELEESINNFDHGGDGNLTATASGDTVTVTGVVTGVTKMLELIIDPGVTVVWKADYSGPGSIHLIYLSGTGIFEVAEGGALTTSGITNAIGTTGVQSNVVVSGGVLKAENTVISANGSIVMSGGIVESTKNGSALNCGGTITVSGGEVIGTITSTGVITINDGTVINYGTGVAIYNYTGGSLVTINGGLVESQVSGQTISADSVTITGGTVKSSGETSAIIVTRNLVVSGGTVSAVADHTIRQSGVNANYDINGGFIFAYGTDAVNTDVINMRGYAAVRNYGDNSQTAVGGAAVACAWNEAAERRTYTAGTSDDLDVAPSGATAVWALEGGESGIRYTNGSNTGFFIMGEVTVVPSGSTPVATPTPTPTPETQPEATPTPAPAATPSPAPQAGHAWSNASDWAIAELEKAESLGLIPDVLRGADMTRPITRAEFAAVSVKVYESLSGEAAAPAAPNPFTDTSDSEVLKAFNVGITAGTSATTFEPSLILNREQAATMLTRVYKRVALNGWTLAADANYPLPYTRQAPFADDADISDWARDSVYFMVSRGIIQGMGNNLFGPRNTTSAQEATNYASATREQALLISTRMVENLIP